MRAVAVAVVVVLLAGCTSKPPAPQPMASSVEEGPSPFEDTLVLFSETYQYRLDQDIPSVGFTVPDPVPAGARMRAVQETTPSSLPCTLVTGKADTPLDAWVRFTSPSGAEANIAAGGNPCHAVVVTSFMGGFVELEPEPGEWTISFEGRGEGAQVKVLVTLEPGDEAKDDA